MLFEIRKKRALCPRRMKMKTKTTSRFLAVLISVIGIAAFTGTSGQSVAHTWFMRGSILEVTGKDVYLCVGKKDGATVGQEMDVVRFTRSNPSPKVTNFKRDTVGKIKILEIVDEHMAKAQIVSGKAQAGDVAEKQMK